MAGPSALLSLFLLRVRSSNSGGKQGFLTRPLPIYKRLMKALYTSLLMALFCSGCAVYAVADTAVSVGATVVKTTTKAAGAVINAVIPDSK